MSKRDPFTSKSGYGPLGYRIVENPDGTISEMPPEDEGLEDAVAKATDKPRMDSYVVSVCADPKHVDELATRLRDPRPNECHIGPPSASLNALVQRVASPRLSSSASSCLRPGCRSGRRY